MITGKENLQQAISEALSMEKGAREFYEFAASKSIMDSTKELFTRLRDWEEKHMHYLEFLYQSLQGDKELSSYEEFTKSAPSDYMESGVPVKEAGRLFEEKLVVNDAEALRIALEIEEKAYNLYRRLSEAAEDSNAQVVFKEMKSQEQKHIDTLMELKKAMES